MGIYQLEQLNKRNKKRKVIKIGTLILSLVCVLCVGMLVLSKKKVSNKTNKKEVNKNVTDLGNNYQEIDNSQEDEEEVSLSFTFTGDIILGKDKKAGMDNTMPQKMIDVNNDYTYFLKNFKDIFSNDDLTVVDFEGTLTDSENYVDKEFNFKAPKDYVNILKSSSVEMATTANNHSHDYGEEGYSDTIKNLNEANIQDFGYDKVAYKNVKGKNIAFIGAYLLNEGSSDAKSQVLNCIQSAKDKNCDLIIVFAHWGIEKEYVPDNWQISMGHFMIDNGADIVVGCHPHVIQAIENYKNKSIVYSFGNFCFGGNRNPSDKDAYILGWNITMKGKEVKSSAINVIPISVSSSTNVNDYCPRILDGDEKLRVQKKIDDSTEAIKNIVE